MTGYGKYQYALSLTSQFYFCGLPLRLDAYSNCLFSCNYCFAAARGGQRSLRGLKVADGASLSRALAQATTSRSQLSVIPDLLRRRQPIHFGGMSEPFPDIESKLGISLGLLRELAAFRYPTVISTKGVLLSRDVYLDTLLSGDFVVQVSFSVRNDQLGRELDHGAPLPSQRIKLVKELSEAGVATAVRLQPLLPGREAEAAALIEEVADAGVRHVGVEYLKMPLEGWSGSQRMSQVVGVDLQGMYASAGASRSGREWLLPISSRLDKILWLREKAHSLGLSFGAADTDLLPISDSLCCCSGADSLLQTQSQTFEFNYLGAIRRASNDGRVTFESLQNCWVPEGSIARWMNSRSRLPKFHDRGAGIRDYIRMNWNGRSNGCSPEMFHGVEHTGDFDADGLKIYGLTSGVRELMRSRGGRTTM